MIAEKLLPKNTFIVFTQKNKRQKLTKEEQDVFLEVLKYYSHLDFIPQKGMQLFKLSNKAYVDFAFMKEIYNDRFEIYITVK